MIKVTHGSKEDPSLELINKELRTALGVAEKRNNELRLALEVAQRDAARWRWAKEHPKYAVDLFDVYLMGQRDFDAAIDVEMRLEAQPKPCPNCKPCVFLCRNGKWELNGQTHDCYGCDGSGIDEKCEEHKDDNDQ